MPKSRKPILQRRSRLARRSQGRQTTSKTKVDSNMKAMMKINPVQLHVQPFTAKVLTHMLTLKSSVNTLNDAPVEDEIYIYEKKKYGRPLFKFKPETSGHKIPGQQAVRFSEGDNGDLHLNVIVEAYRTEKYVIPLDFREVKINFHYEDNGATKTIPLSITKITPIKTPNILKHIYAHALIKADVKDDVYKALTGTNLVAKFEVSADIWWQKPPFIVRPARTGIDPRTRKPIKIAAKRVKNKDVKQRKVTVKADIHGLFEPDDSEVFQGFFSNLETIDYKWIHSTKAEGGVEYSYYYRLTNDPNNVFFLPQVYRIGVNDDSGEPRVHINLYNLEKENGENEYRIKMTFHVVPYFHPRAKKDLMNELSAKSNGTLKYAQNLILGGYKEVSFELEERFSNDDDPLTGKFTKKIENIDPLAGFTISSDFSLESFDIFKEELLRDGVNIGKMYFELQEQEEGEDIVSQSNPITVELNFKKLENIPLDIEVSTINSGQQSIISGFSLFNETEIPLQVEGVELTLLSIDEEKNEVHDVDNHLSTNIIKQDWPIGIEPRQEKSIQLNSEDIDSVSNKNMFWTHLKCEPYGVRANIDPEVIMASVIDRASGDSEIWHLNVICPLYKNWEEWTEEQRLHYKGIVALTVQVRLEEDKNNVFSIVLNKDHPEGVIKMSRSAKQLLQSTDYDNRKYEYRLQSTTIPPSDPGEWINPESTSVNYLQVYPEI